MTVGNELKAHRLTDSTCLSASLLEAANIIRGAAKVRFNFHKRSSESHLHSPGVCKTWRASVTETC